MRPASNISVPLLDPRIFKIADTVSDKSKFAIAAGWEEIHPSLRELSAKRLNIKILGPNPKQTKIDLGAIPKGIEGIDPEFRHCLESPWMGIAGGDYHESSRTIRIYTQTKVYVNGKPEFIDFRPDDLKDNLKHEFGHEFDHQAKISNRFSFINVINKSLPADFGNCYSNGAYLKQPDEIFVRIWSNNEDGYPDEIYDWINQNAPSLEKGLASGPHLVPEIETGPLSRLLTKLVTSLPTATPKPISKELLDLCQDLAAIEQAVKQPSTIAFSLIMAIPGFLAARSIGATLMPLVTTVYMSIDQRPDRGVRRLAEALERKWRSAPQDLIT